MYAFLPQPRPGEKKLSFILFAVANQELLIFLYLSMLRYYVMLSDTNRITHCKTTLRWLLRRGSPLPIPNRVVKPACADGTAVMWESMSSPFFKNPSSKDEGFFVL